jgi:exopolyphosphatase/guanosine-5'-triphosphate,3'-diphosphate pyrophosphatase
MTTDVPTARPLRAAALLLLLLAAACRTGAPAAGPSAPGLPRDGCTAQLRGAFDIGSGSTKVQVARVLVCPRDGGSDILLEEICYRSNEPVPYAAELGRAADNRLPDAVVGAGLAAMDRLRRAALDGAAARCGSREVHGWRGIMTEVFRNAANARDVRDRLGAASGADGRPMPIRILTQDEEAQYGFYPLLHTGAVDPAAILVWDMGGGSTQITFFAPGTGMPRMLGTHLGTGTLGTALLAHKPAGDPLNPIGLLLLPVGEALVREAAEHGAEALGLRPADLARGRTVLGVGGVLAIGVPTLVNRLTAHPAKALSVLEFARLARERGLAGVRAAGLAREAVDEALARMLPADEAKALQVAKDAGIPAGFASSLAPGLLLAHAYARPDVLDVPQYTPVQLDATDTLAVLHQYDDPEYWRP